MVLPERMGPSFPLSFSWAQWMNDPFISKIFIECLLCTKHWHKHLESIGEQNYGRLYSPNIITPTFFIPHVFFLTLDRDQESRDSDIKRSVVCLSGLGNKWYLLIFSVLKYTPKESWKIWLVSQTKAAIPDNSWGVTT